MLLDKLTYPEDFPISVTVACMEEDPLHYHPDIELTYVISGEVELKSGCCLYRLHAGDIFTNAGNEVHSLKAVTKDNTVASIHLSTKALSQYFPNLHKACYRTYSKNADGQKYIHLKKLLLQLLMKYLQKGFNYKSECLYATVDLIKHLDRHFNHFTIDKDVAVGFDKGNQQASERISRICQYIYQNYADNMTLQDLADMEYLSTFYLSHLIKEFTGMNFREFLCFARVEMSEIPLLSGNRKVSRIARDVGFSTTAYYTKYFTQWFGHGPEQHRALYLPEVKCDLRPAVYQELPRSRAIAAVKNAYAEYDNHRDIGHTSENLQLDVTVDSSAPSLGYFEKPLHLVLDGDAQRMPDSRLIEAVTELHPAKLLLLRDGAEDAIQEKIAMWEQLGFVVEVCDEIPQQPASYAFDTIAYPLALLNEHLDEPCRPLTIALCDSGDQLRILQGQDAVMAACGVKKPAYYICAALSRISGEVIAQGSQYCVIRHGQDDADTFIVLTYNYHASMHHASLRGAGLWEVKNTIDAFRDELNLHIDLALRPSVYAVTKYSLTKENTLFSQLAALDFNESTLLPCHIPDMLSFRPTFEAYTEDVCTACSINLLLKGAGIQMAIIRPQSGRT